MNAVKLVFEWALSALSQAVTPDSSAPVNHVGDFGGLSNEFPTGCLSFTALSIGGGLPILSLLLDGG